MMTAAAIRRQFLDFFESKSHIIVPSAPIVVKNDPSLLFTNAGMNQFKDYFLGNKIAENQRVADTQRCLRVSGKHNDLEEVGHDSYHHTMFEMLGNWSFGDPNRIGGGYFKKEAIAYSWELLTKVYGIAEDKLYVTVFEGDVNENLPGDEEAFNCWKQHIAEERIVLGNKKDTFWEMGDTGPCGPCTEIHIDLRTAAEQKKGDGKELVNAGNPQVIEIWNIVFIEFNRLKNGTLQPLPARHVDTGMGLERLVRVLQGKQSNYDTDIFEPIINITEKLCGSEYGKNEKADIAFRVISDHIRAICFTIADGQLPSNTGAGYVIRRILRRAVRYYYSYLDVRQPLLYKLVPVVAEQFKDVFPSLEQQKEFVQKVVLEEENSFLRTLESGIKKMEVFFTSHPDEQEIDGDTAFELYDTYGFPIDLTQLMAREKGLSVNMKGFEQNLQQQKERSRSATSLDMEDWKVLADKPVQFKGYDKLELQTQVLRYRKVKIKNKESYQLVLEETPFYAESGGQVGDTGWLDFDGEKISVLDTQKENELIIHYIPFLPKNIEAAVIAKVEKEKRLFTAYNHSATHLLHAALRKVLGTHVAQKGSLVEPERLRFDFSHFSKVSDEELRQTEKLVNKKIREDIPVNVDIMPRDKAMKSGAMALFGEKYGEQVRVVTIDPQYSTELCGGTHVRSTGQIGFFKITSESAVAAGVRRIEAVSGKKAEDYIDAQAAILKQVQELLNNPKDIAVAVKALQEKGGALQKQLQEAERQQIQVLADELVNQAKKINSTLFIGKQVNINDIKQLLFQLKSKLDNNYLVVLTTAVNGKAQVGILISEDLVNDKKLEAPAIIKKYIAPIIKGGGGGQKTLANAGGQDVSRLREVIDVVRSLL